MVKRHQVGQPARAQFKPLEQAFPAGMCFGGSARSSSGDDGGGGGGGGGGEGEEEE